MSTISIILAGCGLVLLWAIFVIIAIERLLDEGVEIKVFYTKENESINDLFNHLEKHETDMVYNTSKKYKITIEEV